MGRLPEALAAYQQTVSDFPSDVVARNGSAVVLVELGRSAEARAILPGVDTAPRTRQDWIAAHIVCIIDLRTAASAALAERLQHFVNTCPYLEQRRYFETTLAVLRITLNQVQAARQSLSDLVTRPDFSTVERVALHLMKAHAEAAQGDLTSASQSLMTASNLVPYEQFRTRRLRQEIERRFGLGSVPAVLRSDEIEAANATILRLETEFWASPPTRANAVQRRAA